MIKRNRTSRYYLLLQVLFDVQHRRRRFFFLFFLFFSFRSLLILSDEASETFDSFDRLHFLFLVSLLTEERKNEPSDSDISTLGEKEKYLSKKEKRKHLPLAPSDRRLAGATDSYSFSRFFFILFVRLCYCCTTFWRMSFFFFFSSSRLLCWMLSLSLSCLQTRLLLF